ncbi:universal stress protein [Rhodococcus sp. HNM0563]|uniref:universal stress protein n=1 Tax=Rhodococcus sp. HNM0563 TaxID=2716339 RepID=UPI00146C10DD|nr:universal stress protein [Rhodococcus sp. HNM0563]
MLSSAVAAVREYAAGSRLTTMLGDEPATTALLTAAKGATMVVLGATGRGTVERWLLGSTAVRVVNHAECPVVVWRGDPADRGPDTGAFVVGLDGSATSTAAEFALTFADLLGVPITAVRSWTDEYAIGAARPETLRQSGPTSLLVDWGCCRPHGGDEAYRDPRTLPASLP